MDTTHADTGTAHRARGPVLWFGALGGAVIWTLHLLAVYAIAEWGCLSELSRVRILGLMGTSAVLLAVSVLATAAGAAATYCAHRAGRQLDADGPEENRRTSDAFLARTGVLLSGLFTGVILVESVPIFFFLSHC